MSAVEFNLPANDLTVICRLCLTVDEKLFQLFRSEEIETSAIPLSMKVTLCTAVMMSKQDLLPKKICQNCLNYINEWYKFRKKCLRNDVYLKRCLSSRVPEGSSQPSDEGNAKYFDFPLDGDGTDEMGTRTDPPAVSAAAPEPFKTETETGSALESNYPIQGDCEPKNADAPGKLLLKSPTKKYKCPFCPDSFYYVKDLKSHKSLIHKVTRSEKPAAKEATPAKEEEIKLDEVNARTRYEMKCCEKVFYSKARFRRHYNAKHPGEKPFMCETCGKKDFISEETLKRHKILHTGKYRCDICSKTFTCNAILIIHKRDKHENDKPFICDVCGKRFVTELLMNYHKRFHTGEKKYVCEECGLAVVTSSSLAKHKRIHSNVKPHICQVCGKGFIIKGRLVEHLRVHTGERPYSCHICHKGFTMRDKLKRHVRIHSGEKLFSCEYCGNNYSTSYGLTVHLKTHVTRNY